MKIQVLGTAAGEGQPGVFCACDICGKARRDGGKDVRSRSSVQIDDIYKIDFPPDVFYHTEKFKIDLSRLKYLFFSHSHADHFTPPQIEYIVDPYAYNMENVPLRIYGNKHIVDGMDWLWHRNPPMEVHLLEAFKPVKADHLTFTPIKAEHTPGEDCYNYVVESDSKAFLYACDTGWYSNATFEFLAGKRLDLIMVECTYGPLERVLKTHMNFQGGLKLRDKLADLGSVTSDTKMFITHFSHNARMLHDELEAMANPEGVGVAYDGMTLEL